MKKLFICMMVVGLIVSGCTGSFQLTRKIHQLHSSQENKWVDELIFLGCVIIPVYGIAMAGDGIIFNSVEFWTGENPVTASVDNSPENNIIIERSSNGVVAKDENGAVLYTSIKDVDGSISVYNSDATLVQYFSPKEVETERTRIIQNL